MAIRELNWDKIDEEIENLNKKEPKKEKKVDEHLFRYTPKNGEAVVLGRFLPPPVDDIDSMYAQVLQHSYKGSNGMLLLEKCPRSLSKSNKCPVCDHATDVYYGRNGTPENKELGKKFFHKASFYTNFLVINDINNPENNGKIFVLKLDKKTFNEKIIAKISPSEEERELGTEPVRVFDYVKGMNFKLKIVERNIMIDGKPVLVPNYDASEWSNTITRISLDGKKPLTDDEINTLIEPKLIPLKPYIEENLKSYDKIKDRLDRVLGNTSVATQSSGDGFEKTLEQASSEDDDASFLARLRGE